MDSPRRLDGLDVIEGEVRKANSLDALTGAVLDLIAIVRELARDRDDALSDTVPD